MNFDSKKVVMDAEGIPIVGFGKDSKVEIEYNSDFAELDMDVDGDWGTFMEGNDRSATIKLVLKGNSPSNIEFEQMAKNKKEFAWNMANLNTFGAKVYFAPKCRVKKIPTNKLGKKHEERTWELLTPRLVEK